MAIVGDSKESMDIYMARVGQSAAMAEGTIAGNRLNDNPLSDKGQIHASQAGENLAQVLNSKGIKNVRVITADEVFRMKQTTDLIGGKLEQAGISYSR